MKKFEIRHTDGTTQVIKAMSEDMARQFAMENKWGAASQNRTWPCSHWNGHGLSAREVRNA